MAEVIGQADDEGQFRGEFTPENSWQVLSSDAVCPALMEHWKTRTD